VKRRTIVLIAALSIAGLHLPGCSTEPPSSADRAALNEEVAGALEQMYAEDPGLRPLLTSACGYAVFPSVGKGALVLGGAYGRGQVYRGGSFIGYADISQATIGLQAGGQGFAEIIAFQDSEALQRFEAGQLSFAANASAVAIKAGAAESAKYDDGVTVFVDPVGGLMIEAAIGGQTLSYQPK
jgi:lipid-binding SYLF domain-containing protein